MNSCYHLLLVEFPCRYHKSSFRKYKWYLKIDNFCLFCHMGRAHKIIRQNRSIPVGKSEVIKRVNCSSYRVFRHSFLLCVNFLFADCFCTTRRSQHPVYPFPIESNENIKCVTSFKRTFWVEIIWGAIWNTKVRDTSGQTGNDFYNWRMTNLHLSKWLRLSVGTS